MNSLSMNEFQSASSGQQQQQLRSCSAQVSSSASSYSLTSGAAGVASCIGGIASGTPGARSINCAPAHGSGGTLGSAGGHSSSGESGAALRVSHEHTDSGLGAEQDYAYSSERCVGNSIIFYIYFI